MKMILLMIALFIITFLMPGCSQKYMKTVNHIDRDRFMGKWYVQAGRFSFLEKDVYNSIEIYTWNEAKNRIDIDFSFNQGSLTGPFKEIPQKAWIENKKTNATWSVSPFWPLKFSYLVIAVDPEYNWTAIGVPNQKYLWIMTRVPHFPKVQIEKILSDLSLSGYPINDIVYVPHR